MKTIKAKVKKLYPQLKEFFGEGEEIGVESILYEKDTVLVEAFNNVEPKKQGLPSWDATIAPKGSYKSLVYVKEDGTRYCDSMITNIIGYKDINEWLEKI